MTHEGRPADSLVGGSSVVDRREFVRLSTVMAAGLGSRHSWGEGANEPLPNMDGPGVDSSGGEERSVSLFLCGDVMTGRGLDQVLPHRSDPTLFERHITSAELYVRLAEEVNGPISRPVSFSYPWGVALDELERAAPDVRIINLETSVTTSDDWVSKGINYRMHPGNVECLTVAKIDCCVLANNHVLDWGRSGLLETLDTLRRAELKTAGAGRNIFEANAPAVMKIPGHGRVFVFSFGWVTSGIPGDWAATEKRAGVNLLPDLSAGTVRRVARQIRELCQPSDVVVASIHWGPNWGYDIPRGQRRFAHALVDDAGVDVVHGHSSHHVKGIEIHNGRPILYGCGDFLTDYEGIRGYEEFRDDLTLMYFVSIDPVDRAAVSLRLTPLQIKRFKLNRPSKEDVSWIHGVLQRECGRLDTRVELRPDHRFEVWAK